MIWKGGNDRCLAIVRSALRPVRGGKRASARRRATSPMMLKSHSDRDTQTVRRGWPARSARGRMRRSSTPSVAASDNLVELASAPLFFRKQQFLREQTETEKLNTVTRNRTKNREAHNFNRSRQKKWQARLRLKMGMDWTYRPRDRWGNFAQIRSPKHFGACPKPL